MNMHWVDWLIVGGLLLVTLLTGLYTKRYMRGVADYLSANRCAGRYLLTVAQGMSGLSAAAIIANYEQFYKAGFTALWWAALGMPVAVFISLSGFIRYRFRETRALTMAQFFEMRYSRKFRVFSGMLCWFSGILNYGVFPGITARLLMAFCGLPDTFLLFGLSIPVFPVVMLMMLAIALYLTLMGGQIALLITDFIQGQFAMVVMIGLSLFLLMRFDWSFIVEALRSAPENQSMMNPYQGSDLKDFSIYFFLMLGFMRLYGFMAWQGSQGYYSSAENAHEAKMSGILGQWRGIITPMIMVIPPVIAFTVLHHLHFAEDANAVQASLEMIQDPQVQGQVRTPLVLVRFLPVGVVGLFASLVISAAVSTDDSYLHSWGSVFVQDVLLPFKKKKLSPVQHVRWLRWAAVGTAVVAFFYSLFFPLREYIFMYFQLTGAVFIGGAGSVIIGGLYWKRGTAAGAWTALITGAVSAIIGVIILTWWGSIPFLSTLSETCPLNGIQMAFFTALLCISLYVIVSLLTCREPFNMDRLLHRGEYAVKEDQVRIHKKPPMPERILGIDKEYAFKDKLLAGGVFAYTFLWCLLLAVGSILNRITVISQQMWESFWHVMVIGLTGLGVITVVWFVTGGIRDARRMFKKLNAAERDAEDDGTVVQTEENNK
jgi:solute:Na+ symporter, SSS family